MLVRGTIAARGEVKPGGTKLSENTDQSTPTTQAVPLKREASPARITAGILSTVLGVWLLFCSGLIFLDVYESFTDTRAVAAILLVIAVATLVLGIACMVLARDRRPGPTLSLVGALTAAIIASLLVYNAYGLLVLVPALLLGVPSILLLLNEARNA